MAVYLREAICRLGVATQGALERLPGGGVLAVDDVPAVLGVLASAMATTPSVRISVDAAGVGVTPDPAGPLLAVRTSGSTGSPRIVVRTLRSWTDSFPAYTAFTGLASDYVLLLTGPLSSTLQLFAAAHAVAGGIALTDDPGSATAAVCVPALLESTVAAAPNLRRVIVAGAPLADAVAARVAGAGVQVLEYYGAAELSFVAARRWPDPLVAFPGVELQLREGEVWSRSAFQALRTEGDAGAFRRDDDGFATVGDRATVDAGGGLRILGRGATALDVGGTTVLVEDVEAALLGVDGVLDAAVTAQPHERLGVVPVAVVVLGPAADLAAVRSAVRELLTPAWQPRRWVMVHQIPRLPGGKVDRVALATVIA